jgi:hypothetical protein
MKSSFNRDNNYCHYVIQRIADFAITLYYHPTGLDVVMVVYHLLYELLLLVFFSVWAGRWSWLVGGGESSRRRVHKNNMTTSGGFMAGYYDGAVTVFQMVYCDFVAYYYV